MIHLFWLISGWCNRGISMISVGVPVNSGHEMLMLKLFSKKLLSITRSWYQCCPVHPTALRSGETGGQAHTSFVALLKPFLNQFFLVARHIWGHNHHPHDVKENVVHYIRPPYSSVAPWSDGSRHGLHGHPEWSVALHYGDSLPSISIHLSCSVLRELTDAFW